MPHLPSLLITDDDRSFRETLQSVIEPLGVRTLQAENGLEALEIVRSQPVHLVLLDMHMPCMSGLETLRMLKQFRSVLPCILMSARLDEMIIEQAKLARAFSILSKPLTRRQITGAVCHALERAYNWRTGERD